MIPLLFRLRHVWLALLLGGVVGSLVGLRQLRFDFTSQYLFKSRDPEYHTLLALQRRLGRQDSSTVILVTAPDVLADDVLRYLAALKAALAAVDGVQHASSPTDALVTLPGSLPRPLLAVPPGRRRQAVADTPLLTGRVISRDRRAALLLARVESGRMRYADLAPVVKRIERAVARLPAPAGVRARITGVPAARVQIVEDMQRDQLTFTPICALVFTVMLWALFRDLRATAIPLFAVGVSMLYTMGLLGAAGQQIDILNNVYPTLIFVIGLSDAIHLINRYRELLSRGVPQELALQQTVYHLAAACFLTSFTTAVGFASLGVARLEILQRFGLWAAAGLVIAYVVTIVLVPLLLRLCRPIAGATRRAGRRTDRRLLLLSRFVQRRPRAILAVTALVAGACIWLGTRVRVTNNLYEAFNHDDPVVVANREVERHFAGVVPFAIVVEWPEGSDPLRPEVLRYLQSLSAFLETEPLSDSGTSIADLVAEAHHALQLGAPGARRIPDSAQQCRVLLDQVRAALALRGESALVEMLYNERARVLRIHAWTGDHGANVLAKMFDRVRRRLADDAPLQRRLDLVCYLSGDGPVASSGINRLIEDLFGSLLLAFVVILGVMVLLLRSLWTALVSMIANIVPLLVTLGFIAVAGMDLRVTSVLVFTISLGLAVDDTIHFMARFREEWRRRPDYAKALDRTFRGSGRPIVVTTVVLALGFGVLLTSRFPVSRTFALCMEVTVIAALAGDLLVLPACLLLFRPMRPPDQLASPDSPS